MNIYEKYMKFYLLNEAFKKMWRIHREEKSVPQYNNCIFVSFLSTGQQLNALSF